MKVPDGSKVTMSFEVSTYNANLFAYMVMLLGQDQDELSTFGDDVVEAIAVILDLAADSLPPEALEELSKQIERVAKNIRQD